MIRSLAAAAVLAVLVPSARGFAVKSSIEDAVNARLDAQLRKTLRRLALHAQHPELADAFASTRAATPRALPR